jgi:uncharacterized RDD family membrane protein YckC
MQTPEGIEYVLHPAGLSIRACAWAIDFLIQWAVIIAVLVVFGMLGWELGFWFSYILIFALNWFYHTAFEVFFRGQSPGKRFMGIRVVRGDGSPVNPEASFLRNLLRFADSFLSLNLIALVCMAASPAFRRIGDWVADTLVVYTPNARVPGRFTAPALRQAGMPWLAGVPPAAPPRKLAYEEKQALLAFARRYPLLGKARADEIAEIWAGRLRAPGDPETAVPGTDTASGAEASASAYLLGIARAVGG